MKRVVIGLLAAFLLAMAVTVGVASAKPTKEPKPPKPPKQSQEVKQSERLRKAVTNAGILEHERQFQTIADANDDNRASGTPGYDQSVEYVAERLRAAGYEVEIQSFSFDVFEENSPSELEQVSPDATTYTGGEDFAIMSYSGSGEVTAEVQAVDTDATPSSTSTSGCEASDFAGFTAGNIALVQRGTCPFGVKAENAEAAGASAVLIFNRGTGADTGVVNGTLGEESDIDIPVLGLDFETGQDLASPAGTTARVFADTQVETRETSNVLADTPRGNDDQTVVVGAHLDSVDEGPGINDNGSGSASILEIAEEMSELRIKPRNTVRFAFWGAEESGLIGSTYYVNTLPQDELDEIALNLNFDMLGSPNYVRFVYDGDGSETPLAGPEGSAQIEQTFLDFFDSQRLETDPTAFDGRSDYGPFITAGIPAGGLFSGAEGEKTEEQESVYGGVAGASYDPCYHQACDSFTPVADGADGVLYEQLNAEYDLVGNLNLQSLSELSDGAAHATFTYAQSRQAPGDEPVKPGKGPKMKNKGPVPVR